LRAFLPVVLTVVLAGCGFHLRGSAPVPFNTLYIPDAKTGIALDLKRNIEAGTNAKVIDDPKKADAILELSGESREKIILSLTGTGRVREFRLRYRMGYRVHDGKGGEYVPPAACASFACATAWATACTTARAANTCRRAWCSCSAT